MKQWDSSSGSGSRVLVDGSVTTSEDDLENTTERCEWFASSTRFSVSPWIEELEGGCEQVDPTSRPPPQ